MENKIINGGAGSGDFGHAGREGLVGGSEPVESRKSRGFGKYKQAEKSEEEQYAKGITKEEHSQLKDKISKMSDEELVKARFDAQKGYENEKSKAGVLTKHEATYSLAEREIQKRTGKSFGQGASKEEIEDALKGKEERTLKFKGKDATISELVEKHGFKPIKYSGSIYKDDKLTYIEKTEGGKLYKVAVSDDEFKKVQDIYEKVKKPIPETDYGKMPRKKSDKPKSIIERKREQAEQMRLFNGKKANNSLYKHEFIEY